MYSSIVTFTWFAAAIACISSLEIDIGATAIASRQGVTSQRQEKKETFTNEHFRKNPLNFSYNK